MEETANNFDISGRTDLEGKKGRVLPRSFYETIKTMFYTFVCSFRSCRDIQMSRF